MDAPQTSLRSERNSFWFLLPTYFTELRIWCTMHNWTSVFGNTLWMASGKPVRHIHAKQVLVSILVYAKDIVDCACFGGTLLVTCIIVDCVHPYYWVNLVKDTGSP